MGRRGVIRSEAPRWKAGRYRRRRRPKVVVRRRTPRPVLDTLVAAAAALIVGVFVLLLSVSVAATFHLPLAMAYGLLMVVLIGGAAILGPRDRRARLLLLPFALAGIVGTAALYAVRHDLRVEPRVAHAHLDPAR